MPNPAVVPKPTAAAPAPAPEAPPAESAETKQFNTSLEKALKLPAGTVSTVETETQEEPSSGAPAPVPGKPSEPPAAPAKPEAGPAATAPGEAPKQETPADPRDAQIAQLIELTKHQSKLLEQATAKPKEPENPKAKTMADYSTEEIKTAIAEWADPSNEFENPQVLIAEAQAELAKRAGKKGAEEVVQSKEEQALRTGWVQACVRDFPEAYDPATNKLADNELVRLAAGAYDSLGLGKRADGTYRALEWAWGVIERQKAAAAKTNPNGGAPTTPAKTPVKQPPAIRAASPASAGPAPAPDAEAKEKEEAALKKYDKTRSARDLAQAIKHRITKTE